MIDGGEPSDACSDALNGYQAQMGHFSDTVGSLIDGNGATIGEVVNEAMDTAAASQVVDHTCGSTDAGEGE